MNFRQLGSSALRVSPLCLGGNVFGWTIDEKKSFEVLDAFVAEGFNFIDTADYYSRWAGKGGESETIIGKWMKQRGNREKLVIATKVGLEMGPGRSGLRRDYILSAAEDALRRLQTSYIDLYQSHRDDLSTPVEETLGAYDVLVRAGKVRVTGASNFSAERLAASLEASAKHGFPRYECLQPHYNLCEREQYETGLERLCVKENLGVIPYYALAAGFLTGKYRTPADFSKSVRGRSAEKYLNERGLAILGALDQVAERHRSKPATVALAWLMARPSVTAPIASATSAGQVRELAAAARLELSADDRALIDRASGQRQT